MTSEEKSVPPTRGTIIVDTSSLIGLQGNVSAELLAQGEAKPIHYLELLRFLGAHGFNIIIPEIVSIEAGQVFEDGKDIGNLYLGDRYHREVRKAFLKDVATHHVPGVRIEPSASDSIGAAYARALRAAAETDISGRPIQKKQDRQELLVKVRQLNIEGVRRYYKEHYKNVNFGDEEIKYLAAHPKPGWPPVFVLAEDKGLRDNLEISGSNRLTNRRLVYSMVYTGLHEKVGFKKDIDLRQIDEDMWNSAHPETHKILKDYDVAYLEQFHFYRAFKELAIFLASQEKAQPMETPEAEQGKEGMNPMVQRFLARKAKTEAAQQGKGAPQK